MVLCVGTAGTVSGHATNAGEGLNACRSERGSDNGEEALSKHKACGEEESKLGVGLRRVPAPHEREYGS